MLEVLVHPFRNARNGIANAYRELMLDSPHIRVLPFTTAIAEQADRLRVPDSIQLATVMDAGASWFLTNDLDLPPSPAFRSSHSIACRLLL